MLVPPTPWSVKVSKSNRRKHTSKITTIADFSNLKLTFQILTFSALCDSVGDAVWWRVRRREAGILDVGAVLSDLAAGIFLGEDAAATETATKH